MPEASIEALADAIRHLHGGEPTWVESVPVTETWEGETAWEGEVQVFDLEGHVSAHRAYAWSYETEGGKREFKTVLHTPPLVDSPQAAVRAAIGSRSSNPQANEPAQQAPHSN